MRLIISEKANTAKKIAQFLSEGSVKEGKHRSVPHHTFRWKGEETVSVGLKGTSSTRSIPSSTRTGRRSSRGSS
jgi:DNA topoisomerase IA